VQEKGCLTSLEALNFRREGYSVSLHQRQMSLKFAEREVSFPFEEAMRQSEIEKTRDGILFIKIQEIIRLDQELEEAKEIDQSGTNKKEKGQLISEKKSLILNEIGKVLFLLNITPQLRDISNFQRYDYLNTLKKILGSNENKDGSTVYRPGIDYCDYFLSKLKMKTVTRFSDQERIQIDELFQKYMRPEAEKLSRELRKYVLQDSNQQLVGNFVAHMTHSAQSFLARSRMELCTEEDTARYNKDDTWHLDLIDTTRKTLEGSLICYNLPQENLLLLRQFNAIDLLNTKQLSAGSFCDEMVKICIEFAEDNQIDFIGFPPQKSGEDLLSNDQRMWRYLQERFCLKKYEYQLPEKYLLGTYDTSKYTVDMVYRIPVAELKNLLVAA